MKDNFSHQADGYAKFRPGYPATLFDFIFSKFQNFELAWDCGTGNGQAATALAKKFRRVYATDISERQILHAYPSANIAYAVEAAEKSALADNSIDLVTVSQALHWFDVKAFYAEVKRVCKPGGVLAVWTYQLLQIEPGIDKQLEIFYSGTLGTYWDHERKHVDDGYRNITFPFPEIPSPPIDIIVEWSLEDAAGFLRTWSAVQKFIRQNNYDPVDEFIGSIKKIWKGERKKVRFPVSLKVAYVHEALRNF